MGSTRFGDDFEWVNGWAEASGLKAAQRFAAEPARAAGISAPPASPPAPVATSDAPASWGAADQLACDVAEIERARDAIIAAEESGPFALGNRSRAATKRGRLARRDAVPVLIGALAAVAILVAYGAFATIASHGH